MSGFFGVHPMPHEASLVPGLRYTDGPAAIDFLCRAFGFTQHLVVMNGTGQVAHAQLVRGDAMVMLGSAPSDELKTFFALPGEAGGRVTATLFVRVEDPDAHYAQAVAAGAVVLREIADQSFGGRAYVCRDPEGHVWQFGSFDPWRVG
jgi:uncharacterized glyoxalase superfamily protein PhnB